MVCHGGVATGSADATGTNESADLPNPGTSRIEANGGNDGGYIRRSIGEEREILVVVATGLEPWNGE